MATIITASGQEILVDDCDLFWVNQMKWNISPRGYARAWIRGCSPRKSTHLHRLVLGAKDGEIVDHINRNKLDNRRDNLRIATPFLNALNRSVRGCNKYKGVSRHKSGWQVYVGGKYIGLFANDLDAALAYDAAAKKQYGDLVTTNKELGLL
jgi:hypothetical protein